MTDALLAAVKFALVLAGIFAVLWLALHVAGTGWSIPFALALVVVALFALRRSA